LRSTEPYNLLIGCDGIWLILSYKGQVEESEFNEDGFVSSKQFILSANTLEMVQMVRMMLLLVHLNFHNSHSTRTNLSMLHLYSSEYSALTSISHPNSLLRCQKNPRRIVILGRGEEDRMKLRVVRYSGELMETQSEGYQADQQGESLRGTVQEYIQSEKEYVQQNMSRD
jgi:hypothetical protein